MVSFARYAWFALFAASTAHAGDAVPLDVARPARGALPSQGLIYASYSIAVPAGATALDLRLQASGNADLYVRAQRPLDGAWKSLATADSHSPEGNERILLRSGQGPGLCACTYYVDVVHGDGAAGRGLEYTLRATIEGGAEAGPMVQHDAEAEAVFSTDFTQAVSFVPGGPNYHTYRVDVGRDVSRVELSLDGARHDLDLYARFGGPMPNWTSAHHRSAGADPDERIVLTRDGAPALRAGSYYVDVGRSSDLPDQATLSARFVRGYSGPEDTGRLPEASTETDVNGEIRANSRFSIDLDGARRYHTYVLHVTGAQKSLLVRALGADSDVDLHLRHDAPIADYTTDPDHSANSARNDEQIYLDRQADPPLRPGRYFLDVVHSSEDEAGPIDLEVLFDAAPPDPLPALSGPLRTLALGDRTSVDLGAEGLRGARFRFDVPRGARSLDIRVLQATRDVDLFLRRGQPITDHHDAAGHDYKVVTARLNERITLDAESEPPLTAGTWYLDVASLVASDKAISFDVVATVDGEVPADEVVLPPYFEGATLTPIERSLQAVVQVASEHGSGSGTNIHPDGWIITNHHVIEDEGDVQMDDIFISFVRDFDEPPEQVFVARVVELDEDLDLALLHVEADIFDRPLQRPLRLPWLPLGDPTRLHHGDAMYIAGFPSVGGFESRTTLSLTRGIVSGFVTDGDGARTWIKTDARINAGNSGGTALDGEFRYVGVPSRERVDDDDELGFSRPTSVIPAAWLTHLGR